jgi:hypothetical protein
MLISERLREAKARIADPAHWCQGVLAQDANGEEIAPSSTKAVKWCASGSLDGFPGWWGAWRILEGVAHDMRIEAKLPKDDDLCDTPLINDTFGHAKVMELYDRAIARAEEMEARDAAL